jgi:hypothetical protein
VRSGIQYEVWIDKGEQWPEDKSDPPDATVVAMSHEAAAERFVERHGVLAAEQDVHVIVRCVGDDSFRKVHVMKTWTTAQSLATTLDELRAP